MSRKVFTATLLGLTVLATARAATRLTYSVLDKPVAISWAATSFPISYSVDVTTAAAVSRGEKALHESFSAWTEVPESHVSFRPEPSVAAAAGKDGRNVVTVADRLFSDSGFLAYTTTWFNDAGEIQEADIQLDRSTLGNESGLQALVEHEVGHFLGLDHSAVVSAVMFPFVTTTRSALDSDDRVGISNIYPSETFRASRATLRGQVVDGAGPIFGAQVVAVNEAGSPVAGVLSGPDGRFEIAGVPPGKYTLYSEPLDGPVENRNLSGIWRNGHQKKFRTEFLPVTTLVREAEIQDNIMIRVGDLPTNLNPRWIGAFDPASVDIKLGSTPSFIRPGQTVAIAIGGDGFTGGMTTFEFLNPAIQRVSEFQYGANYLWATYRVAPSVPPGSLVILVKSGNETATLTGALRVSAPQRSRAARR